MSNVQTLSEKLQIVKDFVENNENPTKEQLFEAHPEVVEICLNLDLLEIVSTQTFIALK